MVIEAYAPARPAAQLMLSWKEDSRNAHRDAQISRHWNGGDAAHVHAIETVQVMFHIT